MTTKRRKAAALPLPKTTEEAIVLIASYGAIDRAIERVEADAEEAIAKIKAARDAQLAPLEAELKATFNAIKPWWAVAGETLTEGKRKSLELAGCVLGHRMTPPKVTHPNVEEEAILAGLEKANMTEAVRVKRELDKPGLLTLIRNDWPRALAAWGLGLRVTQKEEFFIDRVPPKAPSVEIVAEAAE